MKNDNTREKSINWDNPKPMQKLVSERRNYQKSNEPKNGCLFMFSVVDGGITNENTVF